jgi:hypothetical protein
LALATNFSRFIGHFHANSLANDEEQGTVEEGEHKGDGVGRRVDAEREVGIAVEQEDQGLGLNLGGFLEDF